jgi:hypothetical protein
MPLPLIPLVIAGVAGAVGVGKGVKAAMDNSAANDVNARANSKVENAKKHLEKCRKASHASLEALGGKKLYVLNNGISQFVDVFGKLKNVEFVGSAGLDEMGKFRLDKQSFAELKEMSEYASSIAGGAAGGAIAGALTAFGAYGGAMMLGAASTGTAIATLSGVAATNATLAFLGGGSLAAGGLGMAGGMAVLGGLVAGPALAVMGFVVGAKASANLDRAYSNLAEAKKIAEELKSASTICNGIRRRGYMFERLLIRLDDMLYQALARMRTVIGEKGEDYKKFSQDEKKVIAMAASLAKAVKTVLDTPILTEKGELTDESLRIADSVWQELPESV